MYVTNITLYVNITDYDNCTDKKNNIAIIIPSLLLTISCGLSF